MPSAVLHSPLARMMDQVRIACRRALGVEGRQAMAESLEPRQLLASAPLPTLADMENTSRPVVRFETNFGDVDIELFNDIVPVTVQNFLAYVQTGRYDETFFHRLQLSDDRTSPSAPPAGISVLQGGGFAYDNLVGTSTPPQNPPINLEFTANRRSNLARTIAMARGNAANSATNQFYFNLVDNTNLDSSGPTSGFIVFGRVIQGWDNVTGIQTNQRRNFTTQANQNPQVSDPAFSDNRIRGNFGNVPLTASYNEATGVREDSLLTIINAEQIKPASVDGFFTQRFISPEGFNSPTTTEFIEISNPNNGPASYQVIASYEADGRINGYTDGGRELVVTVGTVPANSRIRLQLTGTGTFQDLLREGAYALIVEAGFPSTVSSPQPLSVSISREDAFFNARGSEVLYNTAQVNGTAARDWAFASIDRNDLSQEFILFYNPNDTDVTITVDFLTSEGVRTITQTVEPFRRGGWGIFQLNLPLGQMSARVRAPLPVYVSVADWDIGDAAAPAVTNGIFYTPGWLVNGTPAGGAAAGGLGRIERTSDDAGQIALYNPGTTTTTVTLTALRENGTTTTQTVPLLAGARVALPVTLGLSVGESAALTYSSGSVPIAVQYTQVPRTADRNLLIGGTRLDGGATTAQTALGRVATFSNGEYRLGGAGSTLAYSERLSIFNPFASASLAYTVRFVFSDGTTIDGPTGTLAARNGTTVLTENLAAVIAKATGTGAAALTAYSIVVTGTATPTSGAPIETAGLVTLWRQGTLNGAFILSGPSISEIALPFTDSRLTATGPVT